MSEPSTSTEPKRIIRKRVTGVSKVSTKTEQNPPPDPAPRTTRSSLNKRKLDEQPVIAPENPTNERGSRIRTMLDNLGVKVPKYARRNRLLDLLSRHVVKKTRRRPGEENLVADILRPRNGTRQVSPETLPELSLQSSTVHEIELPSSPDDKDDLPLFSTSNKVNYAHYTDSELVAMILQVGLEADGWDRKRLIATCRTYDDLIIVPENNDHMDTTKKTLDGGMVPPGHDHICSQCHAHLFEFISYFPDTDLNDANMNKAGPSSTVAFNNQDESDTISISPEQQDIRETTEASESGKTVETEIKSSSTNQPIIKKKSRAHTCRRPNPATKQPPLSRKDKGKAKSNDQDDVSLNENSAFTDAADTFDKGLSGRSSPARQIRQHNSSEPYKSDSEIEFPTTKSSEKHSEVEISRPKTSEKRARSQSQRSDAADENPQTTEKKNESWIIQAIYKIQDRLSRTEKRQDDIFSEIKMLSDVVHKGVSRSPHSSPEKKTRGGQTAARLRFHVETMFGLTDGQKTLPSGPTSSEKDSWMCEINPSGLRLDASLYQNENWEQERRKKTSDETRRGARLRYLRQLRETYLLANQLYCDKLTNIHLTGIVLGSHCK
ncbi:uncharacterized protein MELLADRAFT_110068 [Melampsora larici-populina 98AG31]|uniref:Structure-specific endonuclease subunit SLX4 n=1 Tax=Melampsora larici-populina (strain 98AG31 / pathotype 3-4-7) TaxID=747676 RepID=F4RYJ9_MELLP|nr:uncharacterized protein MELLADRAFT_110068 [Melampsora larici-populina 98AG31]EGG02565.1 hypothetical protein MELLADRAFT_110068 [Melampsora larici-populina 98AG31]